jgi:predicted RecA/RadA family phage recombinase
MSTAANQVVGRQIGDRRSVPVAAAVHLYEGTIFFITPAGYATDTSGTGENQFGGIVETEADNSSGAAGDINVEAWGEGIFELAGTTLAQADVGKDVYATDNFTVSTDRGSAGVRIGKIDEFVSSTAVRVRISVVQREGLLYGQVAAATVITNTAVETAFDKTYTIKGNRLRPGDVIRVKGKVAIPSGNGANTLTLKLYLGATVVAATAAVDVTDGGGDVGYFDAEIVIRTNGAGGTVVATGLQGLGVPGTATARLFELASTAIDTTADQIVKITATWSAASAANQARQDILDVEVLRK